MRRQTSPSLAQIIDCRLFGTKLLSQQFGHWEQIIVKIDQKNIYHIGAETKWTPFRRRHFQVHFQEWKCLISD